MIIQMGIYHENSAFRMAQMAIAYEVYRVTGLGHHQTTFEAMELAIGPSSSRFVTYFATCKRKRILLDMV